MIGSISHPKICCAHNIKQVPYSDTSAQFYVNYWETDKDPACFFDASDDWGQETATWNEDITSNPGQVMDKSVSVGHLGGDCQATFSYSLSWTPVGVCCHFFIFVSAKWFKHVPNVPTGFLFLLQAPVVNGASISVNSASPYLQLSVSGFRLNPDTFSEPTITISGTEIDCQTPLATTTGTHPQKKVSGV